MDLLTTGNSRILSNSGVVLFDTSVVGSVDEGCESVSSETIVRV